RAREGARCACLRGGDRRARTDPGSHEPVRDHALGACPQSTTNTFDSSITLRNASNALVLAPIDVVVGGLPSGVTLANKVGDKPDGRPYVSPLAGGATLLPGATLTFTL